MNARSTPVQIGSGLVLLATALLSGSVAAEPPTLTVVPKNAGPVTISDLHTLLDPDVQFQIFEFEAPEKFCLVLGYTHEIAGQPPSRGVRNQVLCHEAGPQRLIVLMRPAGDMRNLVFALHDRDTGTGSTMSAAELPIGLEINRTALFLAQEALGFDREVTLMHWRYGPNPPHPGPRHDVRVLARLKKNDYGIGAYSEPAEPGP